MKFSATDMLTQRNQYIICTQNMCLCDTQTRKDEGQETSELLRNTRSREVHLRPIIPYSPSVCSKVKQKLENACTTFQKINIYLL